MDERQEYIQGVLDSFEHYATLIEFATKEAPAEDLEVEVREEKSKLIKEFLAILKVGPEVEELIDFLSDHNKEVAGVLFSYEDKTWAELTREQQVNYKVALEHRELCDLLSPVVPNLLRKTKLKG